MTEGENGFGPPGSIRGAFSVGSAGGGGGVVVVVVVVGGRGLGRLFLFLRACGGKPNQGDDRRSPGDGRNATSRTT